MEISNADRIAARYGRASTPGRKKARRAGLIGGAVAFLALISYLGINIGSSPVTVETTGYKHLGGDKIEVAFVVTADPGTVARCEIEAQNERKAQVGFTSVKVGPLKERSQSFTVTFRTQEPFVTGLADTCTPVKG